MQAMQSCSAHYPLYRAEKNVLTPCRVYITYTGTCHVAVERPGHTQVLESILYLSLLLEDRDAESIALKRYTGI